MSNRTEHLPIYRDTLEILDAVSHALRHIPKLYRYTLGERMLNIALDSLALVYESNRLQGAEKVPVISRLLDKVSMLKMLFRLSARWNTLDGKTTERLVKAIAAVEVQAEKWRGHYLLPVSARSKNLAE